jgi:hypothetical protein
VPPNPSHPLGEDFADLSGPRFSLREAEKIVSVGSTTMRRWITVGVRGCVLRTFYVGGRRYVRPADLSLFLGQLQEGGANGDQD